MFPVSGPPEVLSGIPLMAFSPLMLFDLVTCQVATNTLVMYKEVSPCIQLRRLLDLVDTPSSYAETASPSSKPPVTQRRVAWLETCPQVHFQSF